MKPDTAQNQRAWRIMAGLCATCQFVRVVENGRGSYFFLCELARADARFVRYPRLPVLRCDGYHARATDEAENNPA